MGNYYIFSPDNSCVHNENNSKIPLGMSIEYGFGQTMFGEALVGVNEKGICFLGFVSTDNHQSLLNEFHKQWGMFHISENKIKILIDYEKSIL